MDSVNISFGTVDSLIYANFSLIQYLWFTPTKVMFKMEIKGVYLWYAVK